MQNKLHGQSLIDGVVINVADSDNLTRCYVFCCSKPCLQPLYVHLNTEFQTHCGCQTMRNLGVRSNLWASCYLWDGASSTTNHLPTFNIPFILCFIYSTAPHPKMSSLFMCGKLFKYYNYTIPLLRIITDPRSLMEIMNCVSDTLK